MNSELSDAIFELRNVLPMTDDRRSDFCRLSGQVAALENRLVAAEADNIALRKKLFSIRPPEEFDEY